MTGSEVNETSWETNRIRDNTIKMNLQVTNCGMGSSFYRGKSCVDFCGDGVEPSRFSNSTSEEFRKIEEGAVISSDMLSDISSGFDPRSSHMAETRISSVGTFVKCSVPPCGGCRQGRGERPLTSSVSWLLIVSAL
jgi:hypothetical protein